MNALLDAVREFALRSDTDELLAAVTGHARRLLDADVSYVGMVSEEGDHAHVRAVDGRTDVVRVGLRLALEGGPDRVVLTESGRDWNPDYLADDQIWRSRILGDVLRAERFRTVIVVPLRHGDRAFAVLNVASREIRHFTARERAQLCVLGDLAGAAIGRARLWQQTNAELAGLRDRLAAAEAELGVARRRAEDHRELVDLVLSGGDLQALAVEAARRLDGVVQVCASDGTVLAVGGEAPQDPPAPMVVAVENAQAAGEPRLLNCGLWATPIFAGEEYLGALILRPHGMPDGRAESLKLLAQAASIVLLRRSTMDIGQARDDLLDDLLSTTRAPQQLDRRARRLGVDLTRPHVVVVARPEGKIQGRTMVWAASYAQRVGGLKTMHGGHVVLLLPGTDAGGAARTVRDELASSLGQPVTVGAAGPLTGSRSVPDVYREAKRCLDAVTALGGTGRAASARDLGFVGVLLSDNHDIDGFIDSVIGPVLDYDRQRSAELVRTLEVYFATGSSQTHAAERLHVHPNTVARRLDRIKELLGANWQQPERAFDIQVALRLLRIREAI